MSLHEAPDRILVINVSRIGDTLLATPAVRALAEAWPSARISFLGHPKRVEIMQHLPFIAATGAITKQRALWRHRLGARTYDLALVLGFDRPLIAYALRASRRTVAFRQGDSALDSRLFRCVAPPAFQSMHAARIPLLLTQALDLPDAGLRLAYAVTADETRWARETLAAHLPRGAAPLLGLQVASFPTKAFRDWPIENFLLLCERIVQRWQGAHLLVFGGELELARTAAITDRFPGKVTSFAGAVTLRQSAALMNELDLYVGVDTGPTHIMGALSAPMVPLYHCQSPSRLLMPLERARCYVVDHPRAAQGCGPETPMSEIPVDAVWARVLEALPGR